MTEVFVGGLLFGFAAAWAHMLLLWKWENFQCRKQRRKGDEHARAVELVQAQLDLAAAQIREDIPC